MMDMRPPRGNWLILTTFVIAITLTVFPLPPMFKPFRPDWVLICVVYWSVAIPHRIGVLIAWTAGLFVDATQGHLLGLNGMALAIIAAVSIALHQRIRIFPEWKQAMCIGLFVVIKLLIALIILNSVKPVDRHLSYWIPALTSAIFWYPSFFILRKLRRVFGVS